MSWLFGTSKKEDKKGKKTIFDRYTSAEDYAEDHREDHDGFEEAMDAWYANQGKTASIMNMSRSILMIAFFRGTHDLLS